MIENIIGHDCHGCNQSVSLIKKRYKDKKYCSTCYARIFKRRICPSCGDIARLPRDDEQAICNECIKKKPCIRCNQSNKPIGKLTEYGVVCNSCSVYFRPVEPCERCGTPAQKLTRISRFNDNLRVCPKCSTRDYETCPLCQKYRLLESDELGQKACKKCRDNPLKACRGCHCLITAGCADLCDDCYWHKNLWNKFDKNQNIFESNYLKNMYKCYIDWLEMKVGSHKAALYINKHTHFFLKTEVLWEDAIPDADKLLLLLRANGLRKFGLVVQWLDQIYDVNISSLNKEQCSETDQTKKLIEQLPQSSLAFDIVSAYKRKLDVKMIQGKTTARSIRLAIKPAVALMLTIDYERNLLPDLKLIKEYLFEYSGYAATLTGFINFINDQYDTNIDYSSLKKSNLIRNASKKKLERELLRIMNSDQDIDVLAWAKIGLQYFHNMGVKDSLSIKLNMIVDVQDGYEVEYRNRVYWLPKNINLTRSKIHSSSSASVFHFR